MTVAVTSPLVPDSTSKPSTGADLQGWTALALLADESSGSGPWLFLMEPSCGWVSEGALSDAKFVKVTLATGRSWPIETGTLGGIVIDGDAFGRSGRRIEETLREAVRVTADPRNTLIVCRHRYVPRHRGAWREYGRPSADRWTQGAARLGTSAAPVAVVSLDGDRITGLAPTGEARSASPAAAAGGDRIVLGLDRTTAPPSAVLDQLVARASHESGLKLRIDSVHVRKIGKTAIFVSDPGGARFIIRAARTPIALSRGTRNFEALESLHRSGMLGSIQSLVPQAVTRGSCCGYSFFVETCLSGSAGPRGTANGHAGDAWALEAADYITALHAATRRPAPMKVSEMERLVHEPIARLERACVSPAATKVLGRVDRVCGGALRDRTLPLVRAHGDYTESNCLFDPNGRLSGVVDWEVSMPDALPFLDLLQLMPVRGETSAAPRWQRFDAWMQLIEQPQRVSADPVMGPYLQALDVPLTSIPALILMQWVTHVADRIEARRDDERWMRLRVWQPLESVEAFLPN